MIIKAVLFNLPSAAWSDDALVSIQKMNMGSNAPMSVSQVDSTVTSIKDLLTALSKDGVDSSDLPTDIPKYLVENSSTVSFALLSKL